MGWVLPGVHQTCWRLPRSFRQSSASARFGADLNDEIFCSHHSPDKSFRFARLLVDLSRARRSWNVDFMQTPYKDL